MSNREETVRSNYAFALMHAHQAGWYAAAAFKAMPFSQAKTQLKRVKDANLGFVKWAMQNAQSPAEEVEDIVGDDLGPKLSDLLELIQESSPEKRAEIMAALDCLIEGNYETQKEQS